MSSNYSTFIKGSVISFSGAILVGIFNYLIRRTLALRLNEIDYGFFYSAFSFISLFLAFLNFGLGQSGTILIAKYYSQGMHRRVRTYFTLNFIVQGGGGLLVCALLMPLVPYLVKYWFKYENGNTHFLYFIFLLIPVIVSDSGTMAALQAAKDFLARHTIMIIRTLLILTGVYFFTERYSIDAAALSYLFASVFTFVASLLYLYRKHKIHIDFKAPEKAASAWETWRLARWVAVSTTGLTMMCHLDSQMLTYMSGLESVALYNIALPIMQIIQTLMILPAVFTPIATEQWHQGKTEEMGRLCSEVMVFMLWSIFAILIGTIILSNQIITILFKASYVSAAYPLIILCAGMPLLVIASFLMNALSAMERAAKVAMMVISGVMINIIANLILIPIIDVSGAALSTVISYLILALLAFAYLKKFIPLAIKLSNLIVVVGAGLLCSILAAYIRSMQLSLIMLLLSTIGVLLLYVILSAPVLWPFGKDLYHYVSKK